MPYRFFLFILLLSAELLLSAQSPEETARLKKELNLKEIIWDEGNGDGVFIAQSKETKKWGMYQQIEPGKRPKKLVSMRYDSLGFFGFNGAFTVVKNEGKYGVISSPWNGEGSKQLLPCKYELLKRGEGDWVEILASKQNGKWGYLNYQNGDTLIPFEHSRFEDLPKPSQNFYKNPMTEYPEKLNVFFQNPDTITQIDLSNCKLSFIPTEIGRCTHAIKANLEGNNFPELPDEFFNLTQLEKLYMGDNPKFTEFDARFSQLKNLTSLVVGRKTSYGSYTYSNRTYTFNTSLSSLKNLETLVLVGFFDYDSLPEFAYQLPKLSYLECKTYSLTPINIDLKRLQCKKTITELNLGFINNLKNWDTEILQFSNLKELTLIIVHMHDPITWIMDLPKLQDIYVKGYTKIQDSEYFQGETLMDYSLNTKPMTLEQRKEAIDTWNKFVESQPENE